jgi:hypothetical protein
LFDAYPRHFAASKLPWGDLVAELGTQELRNLTHARSCIAALSHRIAGGNSVASARLLAQRYHRTLEIAPAVLRAERFVPGLQRLHAALRGNERIPSGFRKHNVFCAANRPGAPQYYVQTKPTMIESALHELEKALFLESDIDVLERAWIANYELLFIHPFDDGNGRLARAVLAAMLQDAIGLPVVLDLSRPMRSVFAQHNLLLRTPRSGNVYVQWNRILDALLRSEFQLLKRVVAAIVDLPFAERASLAALMTTVISSVQAGEAVDEIVAMELSRASIRKALVIKAVLG